MSTLKAIHICNSHQPTQRQNCKRVCLANAKNRTEKNTERTTLCISNSGFSANLKVYDY